MKSNIQTHLRFVLRRNIVTLAIVLYSITVFGQLTGTKTIPGDYATVSAAVTALNGVGVGAGGVTFNIGADYTETITATISLTATGTAANTITFQKDPATVGANPVITAYTGGTGTPATALQDGIWRLVGSDYVTIDGIDVKDNVANATNPSTMEYGYALYKSSLSNGSQFVTITNCVITLNKINNALGTAPMVDGSTGILVVNSTATAAITVLAPTTAAGTNSNNSLYSNTIQNCNTGIALIGRAAASPFIAADQNNDIGGTTVATGNTIINYGGATGATNPAAAIRTLAQYGLNVSYNTINNNNGSGSDHATTLRGIYINTALSAGSDITNNTITLKSGATTQVITAIENASGSTAVGNEVNISDNTVSNSTYSTATTGSFYGIYNTATPAFLTVNNNTFTSNSTAASATGFYYPIWNSGAVTTTIKINDNNIDGIFFTAATSIAFIGIYNTGGGSSANLSISNNDFRAINYSALSSAPNTYIFNSAATLSQLISSNTFTNLDVNATGGITFISNSVIVPATGNQVVDDNAIVGTFTRTGTATSGALTLFTSTATNATGSVISNSNNDFSNITVSGAATIAGWVNTDAGASLKTIQGNIFTQWTGGTGAITGLTVNITGTTNATVSNLISNISSAGNITGINTGAGNDKIYSNTINNLSSSGGTSTTVTGISVSGGTTKSIYQNIISGLSANSSTTGNATTLLSVNGIWISSGSTINAYENTISGLIANAITTGTINGIAITGGITVAAYRNKIYDLSSGSNAIITLGGVNGVQVSGSTANAALAIRNNIIGDLRATSASVADPIRGVSMISTGATSTINVYYNTIYLNAVSSGTNFGSTGIYHTGNATSTVAKLEMINNIIYNGSTPNGAGLTVAYRRSNSTLTNYGTTSNNNLFYAGTPGTGRLLFYDGVNSDQTLAAYKTRMSTRDAASISEDLIAVGNFLSAVGPSVNYLHMDDTKASGVKSGGINIAGLAIDFDNDVRQGNPGYTGTGTAPDIGADEYAGISYLPLSGSYNVGAGQIFTSLTNAGGLFAKINNVGLSGNVTINITSDLSENGIETLNGWTEAGAGNYMLTIQPDGTTSRLISGDVLEGMIRLNGIDRLTIDGGSGKYLTFRNTNTTGTTGTAFTFINGASSNTIRYCNIEAFTNATNSVVFFSTSATFNGGNSNNLVEYCNINGTVGANNSVVGILSAGTNVLGFENANNNISNNNIFNYRDRGMEIKSTGSYGWTVSGNSFYNGSISAGITYASASTLHGIRILGGSGYTLLNNYIGGSAALATGINATYATSTGNLFYQGILLNTSSAAPESNIKGNTIAGINITSFPIAANSTSFYGIETNGSGINIGGTGTGEGNLIGSNTANAAIIVTTSTSTNTFTTFIRGIYCNSSGGEVIRNQVGGIDIKNIGTAPSPSTFLGIYINNTTAPSRVNNNIVGSNGAGAAPNSIQVLSSSTATKTALTGISIGTSVGSAIELDSNIIKNISLLSNAVTVTAGGIIGINTAAKTSAELTITNNSFANNISSSAMTTGLFYGIQNTGASASLKINNNIFTGNTIASTTSVYNAIRNTGAVFNVIEINGNTIGSSSAAAITLSAANSGTQVFINNAGGSPAASLSISNNDIQNINYSANNGTGMNTYISNTAATLSQSINSNSFTNLNVQTTGSTTFIANSVIVPAAGWQDVNNNFISGTYAKKTGGTVTLLTSTATCATGSTININNNNFSNITVSSTTVLNGLVNTDAGNSSKTIQGNIFSNWTGGTSAITGITVNLTGNVNATSNNIIRNISSAGSVTGIATGAGKDNIHTNTIDSLFSSGGTSTIVSGINVTAGTTKNIYQNTISNLWGNSITTGSVRGILISGGTTVNFYQNTIYGLTADALTTGTVNGIWILAGATIKTFRNKIYDLSSASSVITGAVNGIQVSGATANLICTINNNIIGDLRSPAAVLADPIRGISVISNGPTSTTNVYYNTIYLIASSVGTDFGSSGIYHLADVTSTTSTLILINNSITNESVPRGTGLTVAYRRSSNTITNYGSTSNNNMFYAGSPGASNLVFYDGTNSDQTITAFKARMATRDAASVSEDLITGSVFLSATGSTVTYLHIDQNKTTALRGGAVNISGFIDDFNGDIRFGNTGYAGNGAAPDIGADEFAGLQFLPFAGVYNIGTGQNYTSLTNSNGIFSKINSLGLSGHVTINITSDLTETGAEALNQWSETGAGNYTLTIQPDAQSPRLVSGDVLAGMIRLNGADRVRIDGGASRHLTFRNTNTTGTTGTAFTFINGAAYDIVRYCNIEAYANSTNGIVLFSTSATVAGGNSNNLVEFNNINGTIGSNSSMVAVYSSGTSGKENASNTISNNNIFDYQRRAIDITGTGSTAWIISGNSLYNGNVSATINYAAASALHGIRILGGSGYTILNNYIGGNAAMAAGTNAVYASTLGNISFEGVALTTSTATPASNIKGNMIVKISLSSIPISAASAAFTGIGTQGAGINIGGTVPGDGNLVGSNAANGSIIVTTSTTSTSYTTLIRGINCLSTGGIVSGNQVGGFDINNIGTAPAPSAFTGIYVNNAAAPSQVNTNIIGSAGPGAVSNSIRVMPGSTALTNTLSGIELGQSVASTIQLNGNTIQNIANLSISSSGSFIGIDNTATAAGAVVTISNNLIKNISSAANTNINSTIYTGISSSSPSTISNDTISNIYNAASGTAAQIRGIIVSEAFIHTISGNFLSDFSTASTKVADVETGSPLGYTITGIINSASVTGQAIYGNTITNLLSITTEVTNTAVGGIGITSAGASGNIYKNRINSFINTSTGTSALPGISGIVAANGAFNVYNNAIKLDNAANNNGIKVYGINHSTTSTWNYYYNTVSIGGTASGSPARSAAFIRTVNGALVLRNNIFVNTRTGTGFNYSISSKVATPATNWSSSASNYNNLYSSNSSTTGEWGNGVNNTFAQWQSNSGGETNSVNSPVSFIASSYDLVPADNSNCTLDNAGTPISIPIAINTDLNDVSRNPTIPDMGAYEFSYVFSVAVWSGAVSANWFAASNWQCGDIPSGSINVTIPGSLTNYPTINSGTAAINNIAILGGASITVTGASLQIAGTLSNSGTFYASNGTLEMNGSSAQTIPASTFSGNAIGSLTINNNAGVTLGGALNLTDILTVLNGSLAADGYLTLKSTSTATARIAPITSAAVMPISGNVIVERYIPGRRKYRLITSSVTTNVASTLVPGQESESIWGNWQNQGNNITPNTGTIITGGTVADGFDPQTANASLFTYDAINRRFTGSTSANAKNTKYTPLKAGAAYYMFVYGDRTNSVTTSTPNNTVLRSTGKLLTGDQTFNTGSLIPLSDVTGRYTLLGNPFVSPIDWATLPKTDLSNTYWGWDPNLSSTGGYVTVSTTGSTTLISPFSGTTGLNQYIQPGQGFFVRTTGPAPVLAIREQDKVSNFNSYAFIARPVPGRDKDKVSKVTAVTQANVNENTIPLLAINLHYDNAGSPLLADGVLAAFAPEYSNQVGKEDALKMQNTAEGIAIATGGELLSIDVRQMPTDKDTLFLQVSRLTRPQYTLQIFARQLEGMQVLPYLQDNYLRTVQPLMINDTNRVVFTVTTADPASADINRFRILFAHQSVLPVTFISLKATQKDRDIQLDWKVAVESGIEKYQVERSGNGINFTKAGEVKAKSNPETGRSYQWLDANALSGITFYRVRYIEAGGRYFFSKTVRVNMDVQDSKMSVFPNPVKNKHINLHLNQIEEGKYTLLLSNVEGKRINSRTIEHTEESSHYIFEIHQGLPPGIYFLQLLKGKIRYGETIYIE
ncbi:MAG: hypothetical protein WKF97_16115 [Chitinophagaceae bacterium]